MRVCINVCATKTALFSFLSRGHKFAFRTAERCRTRGVASFVIVGADYRVQSEEKREAMRSENRRRAESEAICNRARVGTEAEAAFIKGVECKVWIESLDCLLLYSSQFIWVSYWIPKLS